MMAPFIDTKGTLNALTPKDEKRVTYLATTNSSWLPFLSMSGSKFVVYFVHLVPHLLLPF